MNRLIIAGSPRPDGRTAALAELLFETCIEECPDDELALAPVSTLGIEPCRGCDACRGLAARVGRAAADVGPEAAAEAKTGAPASGEEGQARRCVIDDDMAEVYELLDAADELIVVSPVYFAGAPAQLKALLDRLQPYFWTDARHGAKRPATLHVVGEGGDPHGFEPLVGVVRSSLACAGFALERVLDWVGRIDEDGEITAEAAEHPLLPLSSAVAEEAAQSGEGASASAPVSDAAERGERPQLRLSSDASAKQPPARPRSGSPRPKHQASKPRNGNGSGPGGKNGPGGQNRKGGKRRG